MANSLYDGWLSKQAQAAHPIRAERPGKRRSQKSPHLQFFGFFMLLCFMEKTGLRVCVREGVVDCVEGMCGAWGPE
ncbi:hypothetical protein ACFU2J_33175 [Streptomyces sp. NPDC057387]|uniref:hypothetical protein n=1 Tax=Streptomyces TaxID=1883 RepID=UPI00117FAB0F